MGALKGLASGITRGLTDTVFAPFKLGMIRNKKEREEEELSEALQNNDNEKIRELTSSNPVHRKNASQWLQLKNERTEQNAMETVAKIKTSGGDKAQNLRTLADRIKFGQSQNANMEDTLNAYTELKDNDNPVPMNNMVARWEAIYGGPQKDSRTTIQKEYAQAKIEGFEGSILEYKLQAGDKNRTDAIREYEYGVKNPGFALSKAAKEDNTKTKEAGQKKYKNTSDLRKEFLGQSKNYQKVRDAFTRVKSSTKNPSPAGDLSLIFNYMKMLDPGSVVRESEFATAAATGSMGQRIKALTAKVASGKRLAPEMRADFLKKSKELFAGAEEQHKKREGNYKRLARRNRLPEEDVVIDITGASELPPGVTEEDVQFTMEQNDATREEVLNIFLGAK